MQVTHVRCPRAEFCVDSSSSCVNVEALHHHADLRAHRHHRGHPDRPRRTHSVSAGTRATHNTTRPRVSRGIGPAPLRSKVQVQAGSRRRRGDDPDPPRSVGPTAPSLSGMVYRRSASTGSVGVGAPEHPDNSHAVSGVIDSIENAVGATARAVAVVERRAELLANAVGVLEQWADDEFVGSEGDGLGQLLSELASGGGGDDQCERPTAHAVARRARLAAIAAARLS